MKSTDQMKSEMEKRLANLESRRNRLSRNIDSMSATRADVCQEIGRLQGAIGALDGSTVSVTVESMPHPAPAEELKKRGINMPLPSQPVESGVPADIRAKLAENIPTDREPAPQGFHWGQNSFGEDALIPDGLELPPQMEEPIILDRATRALPAIPGVKNEFDKPEDLF